MLISTLAASYLLVGLVSAVIFYCACAANTRSDREQERETYLDQSDLDFRFNHVEWAD